MISPHSPKGSQRRLTRINPKATIHLYRVNRHSRFEAAAPSAVVGGRIGERMDLQRISWPTAMVHAGHSKRGSVQDWGGAYKSRRSSPWPCYRSVLFMNEKVSKIAPSSQNKTMSEM